jgi:hypothetical protein
MVFRSIEIGSNIIEDELHGFIGNVDEQVDAVCQKVGFCLDVCEYLSLVFSLSIYFSRFLCLLCFETSILFICNLNTPFILIQSM